MLQFSPQCSPTAETFVCSQLQMMKSITLVFFPLITVFLLFQNLYLLFIVCMANLCEQKTWFQFHLKHSWIIFNNNDKSQGKLFWNHLYF